MFNICLFQLRISCYGLVTYPVETLSLPVNLLSFKKRSGQKAVGPERSIASRSFSEGLGSGYRVKAFCLSLSGYNFEILTTNISTYYFILFNFTNIKTGLSVSFKIFARFSSAFFFSGYFGVEFLKALVVTCALS
jgi:hypothetical protein